MQLAQQLTKEIAEKYPRVWGELENKYDREFIDKNNWLIEYELNKFVKGDFCFRDTSGGCQQVPFSMLYGLLENFFNKHGIDILIPRFGFNYRDNKYVWSYLYHLEISFPNEESCHFQSPVFLQGRNKQDQKTEVKYQAILKACEILNKQLEVKDANSK